MDSLNDLLAWLNAAGVPILTFAIFVLIRALKQQTESYKGSNEDCKELVKGLQAEVQRLRTALESADLAYQRSMERIRELSARSHLVATALSEAGRAAPTDEASEIQQIQVIEAVAMVSRLLVRLNQLEEQLRGNQSLLTRDLFENFYRELTDIMEGERVFRNPHARWALTVVLGGSPSGKADGAVVPASTGESILPTKTSSVHPKP